MFTIVAFLEILWCFGGKTRLKDFGKELTHCMLEMFLFTDVFVHLCFLICWKVQMQLVLNFWLWRFAKLYCTLSVIVQIDLRLEKIILYCACLWFMQHRFQSLFIWYHFSWNSVRLYCRSHCRVCSWSLLWDLIWWTHLLQPLKSRNFYCLEINYVLLAWFYYLSITQMCMKRKLNKNQDKK